MKHHPFADHIAMTVEDSGGGCSRCRLVVDDRHLNPHGVVHGAVLFALADTGMGAALYPTLDPDRSCATIDIRIAFVLPVRAGEIVCDSTLLRQGRTVAHVESRICCGTDLVAIASGSFAIFERRR